MTEADFYDSNSIKEISEPGEVFERFRQFFSVLPDPAYLLNKDGIFEEINEAFCRETCYSRNEIIGKSLSEDLPFLPEESRKKTWNNFRKRQRGEDVPPYLIEAKTKEGEVRYAEINADTLEINGEIICEIGIARDVTDRIKAERKASREREKTKQTIEAMEDAILIHDMEGEIVSANSAFEEISEYEISEIIGRNVVNLAKELVEPNDLQKAIKNLESAMEGKSTNPISMNIRTPDGQKIPINLKGSIIRNEQGNPERIVASARDMSEVKEAEEKFRRVFEASPDPTYLINKDGVIELINKAAEQDLGIKRDQVVGKSIHELANMPEESRRRIKKNFERRMKGEEVPPYVIEWKGADGNKVYSELNAQTIKKNDEIVGEIASARDITERVKAERKLLKSEERYRSIIRDANIGIGEYGDDGRIEALNPAMKDIIGYEKDEIPTKDDFFEKLFPDEEKREEIREEWAERIEEYKNFTCMQTDIRDKYDEKKNLIFSAVQLSSGNVIFFAQDITELKKTQQKLRRTKERFKELFQGANEIIITTDPEGYIKRVNKKAVEFSGYEGEEIIGKSILDFAHPEDKGRYIEFWKRILDDEEPVYEDLRVVNKDDETIHVISSGRAVREDDEIIEIQYNAQDITELVRTRQELEMKKAQLEEKTEELERKTEELESFVYTVSHDLKTPLVSISGYSDLLSEDYEDSLDEEGMNYLNRIIANVEKMDNLIDDLLQLSRIDREEIPKENIPLENVIDEVKKELSEVIKEKEIDIEIGDDLPKLYFEENRLYQIFSNLISNACKYMDEEGERLIKIDAEDKDDSWILQVKDTGIGIKPENQDKIFEVFHREKRTDEKGTGVGLAIVERIVKAHEGEIWLESEIGEGTTFYIEFPKEKVQA